MASSYNGIDEHDRETFIDNVFEMGSVNTASSNLRAEDTKAARPADRLQQWVADSTFAAALAQAETAAKILHHLKVAISADGGLTAGQRAVLLHRATTENTGRWRSALLEQINAQAPVQNTALSALQPIWAMKPHDRWYVTIDESGSRFGRQSNAEADSTAGRFVAVALQEPSPIEPLPSDYHGTTSNVATTCQALHALACDAAGVLGVRADESITTSNKDGWASLLTTMLEFTVLMLPLSETAAAISIAIDIEQRAEFAAGLDVGLMRQKLVGLVRRRAQPGQSVTVKLRIVPKPDAASLQPYADAVSYSWSSGEADSPNTKQISVAAELTALLPTAGVLIHARHLPSATDAASVVTTHHLQTPAQLQALIELARQSGDHSPAAWLLHDIAAHAKRDKRALNTLHQWVTDHIDDPLVDLRTVQHELDWFTSAGLPTDLTSAGHLVLATAQLDADNLTGRDTSNAEPTVVELTRRLRDTHPLLCTQADLVLLSFWSNRFEFEQARTRAVELVGRTKHQSLLWQARAHSALGQMNAFCGRWKESGRAFDRALHLVTRFAEHEPSHADDVLKIAVLRALASWDAPADSGFGEPTSFAALLRFTDCTDLESLVCSDDHRLTYVHHALWRRLCSIRAPEPQLAEILGCRSRWHNGTAHHPWPLIHLYRTIVLASTHPATAQQSFDQALEALSTWPVSSIRTLIVECMVAIGRALELTIAPRATAEATPPANERPEWLQQRSRMIRAWRLNSKDPMASIQALLGEALPYSLH